MRGATQGYGEAALQEEAGNSKGHACFAAAHRKARKRDMRA